MNRTPHSRPTLGDAEVRAVARVLSSGMLAQGPEAERFEQEVAAALGRRHGAAVSSGTAALHLALLALGVGPGDRVLIPSYACSALLHAVEFAGAKPRLVDVDPRTFNLDPDALARRVDRRSKVVLVPHMFGAPADVDAAVRHGLPVIEDCALSLGSEVTGRTGRLAVTSFYATKMMTTGEGGLVAGDNRRLIEEVRELRSYDGRHRHRTRFNYKMTDLEASLGRVQLGRLDGFVRARRRLAALYREGLQDTPLELPGEVPGHVYFRFVVRAPGGAGHLLRALAERGVDARRPVQKPLHRFLGEPGFTGTDDAFRHAVSIPLYPDLEGEGARRVVSATREAALELYG